MFGFLKKKKPVNTKQLLVTNNTIKKSDIPYDEWCELFKFGTLYNKTLREDPPIDNLNNYVTNVQERQLQT